MGDIGVLGNIELSVICMLGTFYITVVVLLSVLLFFKYRNRGTKEQKFNDMKKRRSSASVLMSDSTIFHLRKRAFIFKDNENSTLNYTAMFRTSSDKLALKIREITIGGNTKSIKPHILQLDQLFFRILLNNNATNSIIISDFYDFSVNLLIDEIFLFSLKEFQLKSTSVIVELFVTLVNSSEDLLLGWTEIKLLERAKQYPFSDSAVLREVNREVDLYLRPSGYACISLGSLHNILKVVILALTFSADECPDEFSKEFAIYLSLEIKNDKEPEFVHSCKTSCKAFTLTTVWNEIFLFEVPNEKKADVFINIELWKTSAKMALPAKPQELLGRLLLGLSEKFPHKSQMHWKNIVDVENVESSMWHPLRSLEP